MYLFKSKRLGFRNWSSADIRPMSAINADKEVMYHFPSTQSIEQTQAFIERMQHQFETKGFCYFAVDLLETNEFIGFIGLSEQTYEADFTPCIDIGWRLAKKYWGMGYATEGAEICLAYGFDHIKLTEILSIASITNTPSINVMEKIGMTKVKEFEHPLLLDYAHLKTCVLYRKVKH